MNFTINYTILLIVILVIVSNYSLADPEIDMHDFKNLRNWLLNAESELLGELGKQCIEKAPYRDEPNPLKDLRRDFNDDEKLSFNARNQSGVIKIGLFIYSFLYA